MITPRPRKDGTTAYYVTVEYPAMDGKRDRRSGTFDTQKEAKRAERSWQQEASAGGKPPSQQTIADYMATWLAGRRHTVEETTWEQYRGQIDNQIVPHMGAQRIDKLATPTIQAWLVRIKEAGNRRGRHAGGPLSPKRANGALAVLRMALGDAAAAGIIPRNPAASVRPVAGDAIEYPEWTEAHLDTFLAAVGGTPLGPCFVLALLTGCRRGELLGLRWADVDWEGGILRLRQQNRELRGAPQIRPGLKGKRARAVHVGDGTLEMLAAHQARQREQKMRVRLDWQEHDLLFPRDDGTPRNPSGVSHAFSDACRRAGLPHIKLHMLRAINAGVSVAEGADPRTLADRLGHSRPSMTQDHYLLRSTARHRAVADAVEAAILKRSAR